MLLLRVWLAICFALFSVTPGLGQPNEDVRQLAEKSISLIRQSIAADAQYRLLADAAVLFARNHEQEFAQELFQEVLAVEKLSERRLYTAQVMSRAGFFDDALSIAKTLPNEGAAPKRMSCHSMILCRMCEHAKEIVEQLEDAWQVSALANLAVASHRRGNVEAAKTLIEEAFEIVVKQKSDAFTTLVSTVVEQMPSDARAIVDRYVEVSSSRRDLAAVLGMHALCGNVEGVRRIAVEYRDSGLLEQTRIESNIKTCLAISQLRSGALDDALETLGDPDNADWDWIVIEEVVNAFVRARRPNDALKMLEAALIEDDTEDTLPVFLLLAKAFAEIGDEQKAQELLSRSRTIAESLRPFRIPGWSFDVAQTYAQLDLVTDCECWIETLQSPTTKADALIGLANGILDREQKAK